MPKLTDPWFEAHFFYDANSDGSYRMHHPDGTPTLFREAQGIELWCPCGYGKPEFPLDGGRPHLAMVPFSNPPSSVQCPPSFGPYSRKDRNVHPRWTMSGDNLETLTCQPSIAVGDPECWHGYITNGEVQ